MDGWVWSGSPLERKDREAEELLAVLPGLLCTAAAASEAELREIPGAGQWPVQTVTTLYRVLAEQYGRIGIFGLMIDSDATN